MLVSSGDTNVRLYDLETSKILQCYADHVGDVQCVAPNATGKLFLSGASDATIAVWDICCPNPVCKFAEFESDIKSIRWFHLSEYVFAGSSDDASCRLFDLRYPRDLHTYTNDYMLSSALSVDFSASGRYLFAGYEDGTVAIYNTLTGAMQDKSIRMEACLSDLQIAPNKQLVAVACHDAAAYLFQ